MTLGVEAKTYSTDGHEMARIGRILFDLLTKSFDVSVESSSIGELESPPQRVQAGLSRHDLTEMGREEGEEVELLSGEIDVDSSAGHRSSNKIHGDIAKIDRVVLGGTGGGSPEHCPHAGDELAESIGLSDVVSSTDFESENDVHFA
jgi:hypothetical protein